MNAAVPDEAPDARRHNPYVGPRPFRNGEPLPARGQETRELTDLLIAERIVLLHAPSGAGKTSLLRAGLVPRLEAEHVPGGSYFRPSEPLRPRAARPAGRPVRNPYVLSVALGLLPGRDARELDAMTLREVVEQWSPQGGDDLPVIIFDQFEEALTDPVDRAAREAFFAELGELLEAKPVWALFAMREDYLGALAPYQHHIPGFLQATYRLDFLDVAGARAAIQQPAADYGVAFAEAAADELIGQLRMVRIPQPAGGAQLVQGPYVQSFQLQVVCRSLWQTLARQRQGRFREIDLVDVRRHVDVYGQLRRYYRDAVQEVAAGTGADEAVIRDWFETQLITPEGFRSQTLTGPRSGEVSPTTVTYALEDAYLIRSDVRAGTAWFELVHDQMIEPVIEDNRVWRAARLQSWQLRARDWRTNRAPELLLTGPELRQAQRWADSSGATPEEQEFLQESTRRGRDGGPVGRARPAVGLLVTVIVVQFAVIVVLLLLLATG